MGPLAIITTGLQVASAVMGAQAEAEQASYEGRVASENARRAELNAQQIRIAGAQAEQAKRREIRKSLGRSAAAVTQAGIGGPGEGSAGALLKEASAQGEFDAMNVRYGYASDAYAQDLESLNQKTAAQAAKRRARGAKTAGYINAATALIGGASNYSGMRRQMKTYGGGRPVTTRGPPKAMAYLPTAMGRW